jgi:hypothetical protein
MLIQGQLEDVYVVVWRNGQSVDPQPIAVYVHEDDATRHVADQSQTDAVKVKVYRDYEAFMDGREVIAKQLKEARAHVERLQNELQVYGG